jgi:hypothetical protein
MSDKIPEDVRDFAKERSSVDAVVQRIGHDTWDLLLIDGEGAWTRWVTTSKEGAEAAAKELGAELHDGWDADELAKRMNRRDEWNTAGGTRRAV